MSIFNGMNISGSALTANRFKMDVISSNLANADTTRARINEDGEWEPYRRKVAIQEAKGERFNVMLKEAMDVREGETGGVKISRVVEDPEPFKQVYNPSHPDADENGYVAMPNVNPLKEMIDLMSTTRAYEANVTALNASKGMLMKALEIGR